MSYTTMYAVPETGEAYEVAEFSNAFRSAFLVWKNLGQAYLSIDRPSSLLFGPEAQRVWNLAWDKDVPLAYRIVMAMTFDHVMVRRENFGRLIDAIEEYSETFDPGSLGGQAQKLRELMTDENVYAVCWNQTSVAQPVWQVREGEDDYRMYDLSRDSEHWFLFDEIGKEAIE